MGKTTGTITYTIDYPNGASEVLTFAGDSRAVTDPKLRCHMFMKHSRKEVDYSIRLWMPLSGRGDSLISPLNALLIEDEHWTLQPLSQGKPNLAIPNDPPNDPINHPQHYNQSPIEVIDAIEAWGFNFCEGRIVQLLFESRIVGASIAIHNLNRIKWYVDRLIARNTPKGAKLKEGDTIKFTVTGTDSLPEDECVDNVPLHRTYYVLFEYANGRKSDQYHVKAINEDDARQQVIKQTTSEGKAPIDITEVRKEW